MRKTNFLWLMMVIFCVCITSCDDGDDSNNILENEYFVIEGSTFVDEKLPTGSEDLITSMSINNNVLNGGSSIITIYSEEELKKAYIGIYGIKGYYEYDLKESMTGKAIGTYSYEIILLINQNIAVNSFSLSISVEATDGRVSKESTSERISVIEAGTGLLQVSLTWDLEDDVDLHVIEPDGNHISYYNPFSSAVSDLDSDDVYFYYLAYIMEKYTGYKISNLDPSNDSDWDKILTVLDEEVENWNETNFTRKAMADFVESVDYINGFLDIDSNPGCEIDGIKSENIYFTSPQSGVYDIYVDLFEKCKFSTPGAKYSVTVRYKGDIVKISNNQIGQFDASNGGNFDREDGYVYIGSFTIDGTRSATKENVKKTPGNPYVKQVKDTLFGK